MTTGAASSRPVRDDTATLPACIRGTMTPTIAADITTDEPQVDQYFDTLTGTVSARPASSIDRQVDQYFDTPTATVSARPNSVAVGQADRYFEPVRCGVAGDVFATLADSGYGAPGTPPLTHVLDADALDSLFPPEITAAGPVEVVFDSGGANVVVSREGVSRANNRTAAESQPAPASADESVEVPEADAVASAEPSGTAVPVSPEEIGN